MNLFTYFYFFLMILVIDIFICRWFGKKPTHTICNVTITMYYATLNFT